MYAKGGPGGTTGGQGGGSASMGSSPNAIPMGISNIMQLKQMQAQIDLINAQRLKTEAETPKTGNLGDVAVGKGTQEIENLKADTALKYINGEVAKIMTTANVEQIDANVEQIKANTAKLETEGKILSGQADDILQQTAINTMQKKLEPGTFTDLVPD